MTALTVMGIDLGTQGIKLMVYDACSREIVATVYETYPMHADNKGTREQNAADWITAFHTCLDKIDPRVRASIKAMGVSGQQHGFVPVSAAGEVLAPVKLWCDTSTQGECVEIMDKVGGQKACQTLSGNAIAAGFTASKILWFKKNHPEQYVQMATIMLPHDYLNFYLTGERKMENGDASGTGLLSIRDRRWCKQLVRAIDKDRDLMDCLPTLIDAEAACGVITAEVANKTGLPKGAVVSSGGGDNMMAAIGTGNVKSGQLTASLGTSGTLFGYSDEPIIDPEGDLAAFCSSTGGWLPLLCTMNCTVATEQLRALVNVDISDIDGLVQSVLPGSEGVITLPFFNGERTPNLPNGKAVIYGLDTTNCSKGHLLRSAMEAAIFGLKTGLEAFQRCGMEFSSVVLMGGGSASGEWRQIAADILGLPVRILDVEENAAFGAALQALWCLNGAEAGTAVSLEALVTEHLTSDADKNCEPITENLETYEEIYQRYKELVSALTPIFNKE